MHIGIYDLHNEIVKVYPDPVKDILYVSFR